MEAVVSAARQRTYPVPKQVAAEAARGLDRVTAHGVQISEASIVMGTMLASGGSLTADMIPLINDFLACHTDISTPETMIERNLWGGRPAEVWTGKVLAEAQRSYDSMVAAALDTMGYEEGCTYLGLCDPEAQEDIVSQLARSRGDALNLEVYDAQNASWSQVTPAEVRLFGAFELDRDMVGFVASAFHAGTSGVVLQYAVPIAFLPAAMTASIAQVDDVATGMVYAVVDSTDNTAVMNVIKLVPGPKVYTRDRGRWNLDPSMLKELRGINPPKLVELQGPQAADVVAQVDLWNAANPTSKPVGVAEIEIEDQSKRSVKSKTIRAAAVAEELTALEQELAGPVQEIEEEIRLAQEVFDKAEEDYAAATQQIRDRWQDLGPEAVETMVAIKRAREDARKTEQTRIQELRERHNWVVLRNRVTMQETAIAAAAELRGQLNALELLETMPVCGAGGADRNQGNAETLRRYWLRGKGALKIAWGTSGDFTRCVRHLRKYLGARTEGYCAKRHHDANGFWPGDRRNK